MASINRVTLLGNLGADPETRQTVNGHQVTTFNLATNNRRKDADGEVKAEWHRIVVWDDLAATCARYLRKGRRVFVEGQLTTRKWEDNDGQTRYSTEIVAHGVQFLDGRPEQEAEESHPF